MGRPPWCEKIGVKKGPWTPEEDIILVSYIQQNGPGNWRSVPSNTGTTYTRPDYNFISFPADRSSYMVMGKYILTQIKILYYKVCLDVARVADCDGPITYAPESNEANSLIMRTT